MHVYMDMNSIHQNILEIGRMESSMSDAIKILKSYFELVTESEDESENPEWDRGFQAAIAILQGEQSRRSD